MKYRKPLCIKCGKPHESLEVHCSCDYDETAGNKYQRRTKRRINRENERKGKGCHSKVKIKI